MTVLTLTPTDVNYLTSNMVFNQLNQNKQDLIMATGIAEGDVAPKLVLDGSGRGALEGKVVINTASTSNNMELCTLPTNILPTQESFHPVVVLRNEQLISNGIKISADQNGSLEAINIVLKGYFETIPTLSISGPGAGATFITRMAEDGDGGSPVITTSQSGVGNYAPGDLLKPIGGTYTTQIQYAIVSTQVSNYGVNAAGTGGTPGTATVTGTTGTGTKFQMSVLIDGSGRLASINSLITSGDYTVNPTDLSAEPVTGAGLTGATVNLRMGVKTVNKTVVGDYTVLPANPVDIQSVTGIGTGAQFTIEDWSLLPPVITNQGSGYTSLSALVITGGNPTLNGSGTLVLGSDVKQQISLLTDPEQNDVVCLDGVNFFTESYK